MFISIIKSIKKINQNFIATVQKTKYIIYKSIKYEKSHPELHKLVFCICNNRM